MFEFFKKQKKFFAEMLIELFKKKERNFRPQFDKKLVQKLTKDHLALFKQVGKIETAFSKNDTKKTKKELQILRSMTLDHFIEEDLKLYWYLKTLYADNLQTLEEVKYFEESIKDIQVTVINFFEHFSKKDVALDANFRNDFNSIVKALITRIETEEKSLYTLYQKA